MPDALSPAQIDRIEDALEDLERDGVESLMAGGEADPAVEDALSAYRSILQLSREAMPAAEVPAGLLDDVIAQAHEAGAQAATAPEPRVPWYRKIRWNMWGPGLAFAATAAVLLLVVRPASDESVASNADDKVAQREPAPSTPAADAPTSDDRIADATQLATAEKDGEGSVARGEGLLDDLEAQRKPAEDELAAALEDKTIVEEEAPEPDPEPADDGLSRGAERQDEKKAKRDYGGVPGGVVGGVPSKKSGRASAGGGKKLPTSSLPSAPANKKKGAKPNAGPMPAPKPAPNAEPKTPPPPPEPITTAKDDDGDDEAGDLAWEAVLTGDKRRRAGNCNGAKAAYNDALSGDARTKARALAGLGLCALAAGSDKTADTYFTKARKADASVKSFIDAERAKMEVGNAPNAAQKAE